jgi:hypothetical protein
MGYRTPNIDRIADEGMQAEDVADVWLRRDVRICRRLAAHADALARGEALRQPPSDPEDLLLLGRELLLGQHSLVAQGRELLDLRHRVGGCGGRLLRLQLGELLALFGLLLCGGVAPLCAARARVRCRSDHQRGSEQSGSSSSSHADSFIS